MNPMSRVQETTAKGAGLLEIQQQQLELDQVLDSNVNIFLIHCPFQANVCLSLTYIRPLGTLSVL